MSASPKAVPPQLALELPHREAQGAEDFLVSRSNAAAVEVVDAWPNWSYPAVLVMGPRGAGKSHLANVWRLRSGAHVVAASSLADASIADFENHRALVVEDIDRGIGGEQILFHLLNTSLGTKREYDAFVNILREATSSQSLPLERLTRHYLALVKERTSNSIHHEMQRFLAIALARTKNSSFRDREDTLLSLELRVVRHLAIFPSRVFDVMERVASSIEAGAEGGIMRCQKITLHFEGGDQVFEL